MGLQFPDRFKDLGYLILRAGMGIMFIHHGYGMLAGGAAVWEQVGSAVGIFGITFGHKVFGLLATFSEFGGGICLILGIFFRPACLMMFLTMSVATLMHLSKGDGLAIASHAIEAGIVFFSLMLIGPKLQKEKK